MHCLSVTFPSLCGTQNMRTLIEGDSITCPSYGYADYVAARLGMNYTNFAVSGSFFGAYDKIVRLLKAKTHARVILVIANGSAQIQIGKQFMRYLEKTA